MTDLDLRNNRLFIYNRYPRLESQKISKDQIPNRLDGHVRIVVISDTHTMHDCVGSLPPCDIFVHCGDILMEGSRYSPKRQIDLINNFNQWLGHVPAALRIVIGGNHDAILNDMGKDNCRKFFTNACYAENDIINYNGIKIWATPLSHGRSSNKAFQSETFAEAALLQSPNEADILITHGTCPELASKVSPKLHLFGHYHWHHGIRIAKERLAANLTPSVSVCACICDGNYDPVNPVFVIDYPCIDDEPDLLISIEGDSQLAENNPIVNVDKAHKIKSEKVSILNSVFKSLGI
jgi:predicted phosphodiesterase